MGPVLLGSVGRLRGPSSGGRATISCPLPSCPLAPDQTACRNRPADGVPSTSCQRQGASNLALPAGGRQVTIPGNETMQRRQPFKKPSSPGSCNPAKIEVRGHSVCVAITASCNPEQITYLCLGSLGSKNRGNNSTDRIRLL